MAHIVWFLTPLTCLHCSSHAGERETRLNTRDLNRDPESISVRPGELLEVGIQELKDAYLTLREPVGTEDIRALEQWDCPVCHWAQWARIVFRRVDPDHSRFMSAETVALTPEVLRDAHFLSPRIDFWVKTRTGEELEHILPLIKHLLS
ncbi:hypothetical protein [Myxococcus xanthus]|uniref:Uncharacterized protein n=1 Tax=Myxococcus xanthus TaxID=34 RepID=A0A7Y4IPF7_MYXXA|nr:hypothetical protein [Myxococcus xanthus]NOJ82987.1 hypothetical protein [Myxococcus xanthus]NOJ90326.1 hypothetical protein [Myxococcus xanthus]